MTHPANRIPNIRRRVNRARRFPDNTCGASRHVHIVADALSSGLGYPMLTEHGRDKGGMRTNGGCRCFKDLPTAKRIYVERLFMALQL